MGIGASIFLIAVGAVLAFAVTTSISGISLSTIGVILMIAGAVGLLTSLVIFGPRRRAVVGGAYPADDVVAEEHRVVRERY